MSNAHPRGFTAPVGRRMYNGSSKVELDEAVAYVSEMLELSRESGATHAKRGRRAISSKRILAVSTKTATLPQTFERSPSQAIVCFIPHSPSER